MLRGEAALTPGREEDDFRSRQLTQDTGPDSYSVFLTSWTFAYESNVFLYYASLKNQSNCWVCGQLPVSSTSGLPWWIFPLQGSDWIALRKFILEERNYSPVQPTIGILGGIPSPSQLIISAPTLAIDMNFLLGSLKLNQNNKLSLNQKRNLPFTRRKPSTIMGWIYVVNNRL